MVRNRYGLNGRQLTGSAYNEKSLPHRGVNFSCDFDSGPRTRNNMRNIEKGGRHDQPLLHRRRRVRAGVHPLLDRSPRGMRVSVCQWTHAAALR